MAKGNSLQKKYRKKEVFFDGFAVGEKGKKDALVALSSKNCVVLDGALTVGVGVERYSVNGNVVFLPGEEVDLFLIWNTDADGKKREKLGYIDQLNRVYVYSNATGGFVNAGGLTGGGTMVSALEKEGACRAIFVSGTGIYSLNGETLVKCDNTPCQAVACYAGGRVFTASKDFYLVYSSPFAPKDYTENTDDSGKIALRHDCGKIVGLSTLKNRLCVLYEYGVSMIELGGSARSFVRKDIDYSGGRIFGETLCVSSVQGERAYFLAEDGIYRFDGAKMEKICKNISIRAKADKRFGGAVVEGKYYVTFLDEDGTWRSVCVELNSGLGYETFVMRGLYSLKGKAVCQINTNVCVLTETGDLPSAESACFNVSQNNLSTVGNKTLSALRFCGKGEIYVEVSNGKKKVARTLAFQDGYARMPIALRARNLSLAIALTKGAEIYNMTAELQMLV